MPQMTPGQARLIDPIITSVARGFRSIKAPVANLLFPIVPVGQRAGRIIRFGPDDYKLYNTKRALSANTKRVQFGYASDPFSLVDHSLEGSVPIEIQEEGNAVPGIDNAQIAIRRVQNVMELERENDAALLALNAASYAASNKATLAGANQWSDTTSHPFVAVEDAREAVRGQIGNRPNTFIVGPKVATKLKTHPEVMARLRGGKGANSDQPPATLAQLSELFEMNVVEGSGIYHDGTAFVDIWGKFALLAYTDPASADDMGSPNFGYTYQLADRPFAEEPYYERNTKTWYYPYTDARQPVLAGASAGFLFSAAVA